MGCIANIINQETDNSIYKSNYFMRESKTPEENDFGNFELYYRLYEYTDDICVLEDNPLYPGLLNYVKTGLLTREELIDALEYNKDTEQ